MQADEYRGAIRALISAAEAGHGITLQPTQVKEIAGTLIALAREVERMALQIQIASTLLQKDLENGDDSDEFDGGDERPEAAEIQPDTDSPTVETS